MSETPDDECARCGEVFDIPVGLDPSKYCNLCAQVLVEERGVSLAAAQSDLARLAKSNAELRAEVERLRAQIEAMPFNEIAFESPPCYLCGYNGPRYYQPDTHPCAAKYHDPPIDRRALSNEGE